LKEYESLKQRKHGCDGGLATGKIADVFKYAKSLPDIIVLHEW
jgi:hypothetical protein